MTTRRKFISKPDKEDEHLGPAMRELTALQRNFVKAYILSPTAHGTDIARTAGYAGNNKTMSVTAYHTSHNPKVLAAIREELEKSFSADAAVGRRVLLEVALDKEHPQQIKAAEALLNRGGFPATSAQKIHVTHSDLTGPAMIERITALCLELSLDPQKLLGSNVGQGSHPGNGTTIEGETIEGEVVAAPAVRASRYIQRMMVPEYERVGWVAPPDSVRDHSAEDLVEIVWKHAAEPRMPDTRPIPS